MSESDDIIKISETAERPAVHERRRKLPMRTNIPLMLMMFVMVVFGLVILYSVSGPSAYSEFGDSAYYLKRQMIYTVIGIGLALFLNFMRINILSNRLFVFGAYMLALGFAAATLVFGYEFNGARRWIQIGSNHIQATEAVKVLLIFAYAGYRKILLEARAKGKIKPREGKWAQRFHDAFLDFILPVTLALVVDMLIIVEPHFSCFIIVALVIIIETLSAGIHIRSWLIGIGVYLIIGIAFVLGFVVFAPQTAKDKATNYVKTNFAHVFKRFDMFGLDIGVDEEENEITKDDTRQIDNAFKALGSGGMWGSGLGNSRSKYNYIAEAQNDYIFSVYIEETGFVGGTVFLLLYASAFGMCMVVVWRAKEIYTRMIATGCTALIFVETALNISVELQILPSTGITLPFMSYGGTAQLFLLVAFGLILCVSRTGTNPPADEMKKRKKAKPYGL